MNGQGIDPLDITIDEPGGYVAATLVAALLIRVVTSLLKGLETAARDGSGRYWRALPAHFWMALNGVGYRALPAPEAGRNDYLAPLLLGFLELLAYPVLMVSTAWSSIALWLVLKTAVPWRRWAADESAFRRYLITNALILIISYWVLTPHVSILPLEEGDFLPALMKL